MALGEEIESDQPGVTPQRLLPPQLVVCRQTTHAVHLVAHLGAADISSAPQPGLEGIPQSTLDYIGKRNLVPGKQTGNSRLNQRRRETGEDGGGTAQDALKKY